MSRTVANPDNLFNSVQFGFSQIASGQGRLLTISGQVGMDADGNMVGEGDFAAQFERSLHNIGLAMEAAGGTLDNILLLHIYIVQGSGEVNPHISAGLRKYFPDNPPAASWIVVAGLADPRFLVEVEVLATI